MQKEKTIKIDTENGAVILTYEIKLKLAIQNKELIITEKLGQLLPFNYKSQDAIKQLASIDQMMYEFERQINEIVDRVKEIFTGLEQIIENHGYKLI